MLLRITLFSLLFVYWASPSTAQADSLKSDLACFKKLVYDKYPSLGRFTPAQRIDQLFDSCTAAITPQTTPLEFLRLTKLLAAALQDGHVYNGPSPALRQYLEEKAVFFPLRLQFIGDSAYVLKSNDSSLPVNAAIVAINNRPLNEIREELFRYITSDGAIRAKKYHVLNNVFYFYYLLAYGEQKTFDITYSSGKEGIKTKTVSAVLKKDLPVLEEAPSTALLGLSFQNNIALLTIKTFSFADLQQAKQDLPAFLENAFKTIKEKNIQKLIIDLRGNGGGRDAYGSLLYSYLTDKPFSYYSSLSTLAGRGPSGPVYRQLDKSAHPNLDRVQPAHNNFKGAVWFLINGLSFSVTAEFCAVARHHKRGIFVGEETGGTYCGNTSGAMIDTTLPYTKLALSIPTVKYEMAVDTSNNKDRGIIPDIIITPTVQDILQGQDPQLESALKEVAAAP